MILGLAFVLSGGSATTAEPIDQNPLLPNAPGSTDSNQRSRVGREAAVGVKSLFRERGFLTSELEAK